MAVSHCFDTVSHCFDTVLLFRCADSLKRSILNSVEVERSGTSRSWAQILRVIDGKELSSCKALTECTGRSCCAVHETGVNGATKAAILCLSIGRLRCSFLVAGDGDRQLAEMANAAISCAN